MTTINEIIERYEDTDLYIAIRFDDRQLDAGYEFDNSRHNPNREDARDFTAHGDSDTYELNGTSCLDIDSEQAAEALTMTAATSMFDHCYIVVGDDLGNHDDPDAGEILLQGCRVAEQIF